MFPTPDYCTDHIDKVYEPQEDTFVLLDTLEGELEFLKSSSKTVVLEIGTGTGIITNFIKNNIIPGAYFITTDLNNYACKTSIQTDKLNLTDTKSISGQEKPGFMDSIQCDLASAVRDNSVDVLVFNPPYVPSEEVPDWKSNSGENRGREVLYQANVEIENEDILIDLALCGGPEGMDVTNRVLLSLDKTLLAEGVAYILYCARNKPDQVNELFIEQNLGWAVEKVFFRKAGWEELSVWKYFRKAKR